MITLFAAITGFISSIIPEVLKIYKDINDKKHEINILDRQIANKKLNQSKTFFYRAYHIARNGRAIFSLLHL
ncbi:hypothetical protein [Rickettsia tamurae]|uniref:hypothetical protein n=1 Tax=Rickettsia tamurae TaxID=334545 RepID=UPI000A4DC7FE|nr:hypothetical protein [Rickettsia tamurae]